MPPLSPYARARIHSPLRTRPRVQRAPGIPCALSFWRVIPGKTRAHRAARPRSHVLMKPCPHEAQRAYEDLPAPSWPGLSRPARTWMPGTRPGMTSQTQPVGLSAGAKSLYCKGKRWLGFLDTYRTLCVAPNQEIRLTFNQLRSFDSNSVLSSDESSGSCIHP